MTQAQRILLNAGVVLALLLLGFAGNMDYEDELAEQAFYEEMVCLGHWPDYQNLGVVCSEVN